VTEELPNPLLSAKRVALLGDVHGDLQHLTLAIRSARALSAPVLIQLGDAALIWPGESWNRTLDKISRRLAASDVYLYLVEGNHDWIPKLREEFPLGANGHRQLRANIFLFSRGYRAMLLAPDPKTPGRTLAVLPGANSIDRELRTENRDWWPGEAIADEDLAALGNDHADVLLGHEVPLGVRELDVEVSANRDGWSETALEYAAEGRRQFHRGFLAVRPKLAIGAHWHRHLDSEIDYGEGEDRFRSRVVILDQNGPKTISLAVLDTATLDLQFFTRSGAARDREDNDADR
jgi:hypothetical protein